MSIKTSQVRDDSLFNLTRRLINLTYHLTLACVL